MIIPTGNRSIRNHAALSLACALAAAVFVNLALASAALAENALVEPRFNSAGFLASQGIRHYYRIYGTWPESWATVRDSGLVQAPLLTLDGRAVDPDDATLDFPGDARYLPPKSADGRAYVISLFMIEGMHIDTVALQTPRTFAEIYAGFPEANRALLPPIEDTDMLKLMCIDAMLHTQMGIFFNEKHYFPATWNEFISGGLTPINSTSINPVTGLPFMANGSPGDLEFFILGKQGEGKFKYKLCPIDRNGNMINLVF